MTDRLVEFSCAVHGFRVATFASAAVTCGLGGCQRDCSPPASVVARRKRDRARNGSHKAAGQRVAGLPESVSKPKPVGSRTEAPATASVA